MVDEDEGGEHDGSHCEEADSGYVNRCEGWLDDDDIMDKDDEASLLKDHSVSVSSFSDASEAYFNTTDKADLCCRDEAFARYVLNALVSVGLATEEVDPAIPRNTYMLANVRAAAAGGVLGGAL
ncbi:hypothetical protein IOCL1545_000638400 [Leishmania shawi]|uniref:Uncharacterized protein n=1 Tax=Leishmania shawi TaxID=5680 RepID=A0ABR3E067_9TRYP